MKRKTFKGAVLDLWRSKPDRIIMFSEAHDAYLDERRKQNGNRFGEWSVHDTVQSILRKHGVFMIKDNRVAYRLKEPKLMQIAEPSQAGEYVVNSAMCICGATGSLKMFTSDVGHVHSIIYNNDYVVDCLGRVLVYDKGLLYLTKITRVELLGLLCHPDRLMVPPPSLVEAIKKLDMKHRDQGSFRFKLNMYTNRYENEYLD